MAWGTPAFFVAKKLPLSRGTYLTADPKLLSLTYERFFRRGLENLFVMLYLGRRRVLMRTRFFNANFY